MQIQQITAIRRTIPLRHAFTSSATSLTRLDYVWVRIQIDTGLVGYGECPTCPDVTGEDQQLAIAVLNEVTPLLIGVSATNIERVNTIFANASQRCYAAHCGVDMALFDIMGKACQQQVYQLLGGDDLTVNVNAVIPLDAHDDLPERISALVADGYTRFKVKVGVNNANEVAIVRTIRQHVPATAIVFVDANGAWKDVDSALLAIHPLVDAGVDWVEQPVPATAVFALKQIQSVIKGGIIADESLYSPRDAIHLIKENAVKLFNIKLAKAGGLAEARKIYMIAQAADITCLLGSLIESSLGMLANYHFARAFPMATCGLSVYATVDDGIDVGLKLTHATMQLLEDRPGLGYPDAAVFERYFNE